MLNFPLRSDFPHSFHILSPLAAPEVLTGPLFSKTKMTVPCCFALSNTDAFHL